MFWKKNPIVHWRCMHSAHNISVLLHTQRTYKKGRGLMPIGPVRNVQKQVLLYNSCQKTMHCNAVLLCLPWIGQKLLHYLDTRPSPKWSANPITITPVWKWEFENKEHPIRGLYMTFFEKFLFKFPFSRKRFQMGQKMYSYQLYKL